jgi:FkbM family methyltransferase
MPHTLFGQLLNGYLKFKYPTKIVQIGANDGRINDPIYQAVMSNMHLTDILLVEPQAEVIPFLIENYRLHPRFKIVNAAIGPENDLIIYRLHPQFWEVFIKRHLQSAPSYRVPSGFASHIKAHVLSHIHGNLPESINEVEAIEELCVPSYNLLVLLEKHDFSKEIDLLQVDCEGMDDMVLYCCNLAETKPEIIHFEHCHLPADSFKNLILYLRDLDYLIYCRTESDAIAIHSDSIFLKQNNLNIERHWRVV